jgi:hypothetical protein
MTWHVPVTQSSRRQRSLLARSTGGLTVSDHRLRLRALLSQSRIARFAAVAPSLRAIVPGIATGLGTRHGLIGFCDAGGQFETPLARRLTGQGPREWAGQR